MLQFLADVSQSAQVAWKGYLSVFVVVLAISGVVWVLNKVFKKR